MSNFHGKFVWYELMTTDIAAAEAFYKAVVGWGVHDSGMPNMTYKMFTVGETNIGGLMTIPEDSTKAGAKPGWTGYVAVDDVDRSVAQVTKAGGTICLPADDYPGVGRFAIVTDPQGAMIALFKGSGEPPKLPPLGTPGLGGWHELHAADGVAAFDFYEKLFGWSKDAAIDMGPMGVYQIFARDGQQMGGMMTKPTAEPRPYWLYYINVEDITAAVARVKAGGGQIVQGPHEVPGGSWILQGIDSQGATFALVAPKV
jgi:predicted enzyme related to lactoylglutathione lyase